jgi:hypothetical protein
MIMRTSYKNNNVAIQHQASILHPDYVINWPIWLKTRHALAGEDTVKSFGRLHLPEITIGKDASADKYNEYLERAVFVPFSKQVLTGFIGTIFRRAVTVEGTFDKVPEDFEERDRYLDGISEMKWQIFCRKIAEELFSVGRVGVFTDYSESLDKAVSNIVIAENILSWEHDSDGNLIYVLLAMYEPKINRINEVEATPIKETFAGVDVEGKDVIVKYKALTLENGVAYSQVFDANFDPAEKIPLLRKGVSLNYIPFQFFGPLDNSGEIQQGPMVDIVNLNYAHYRTSGLLETGRHYTSFPVYVVPVAENADETDEYVISPSVVWEVPIQSKPFVLEFYGQGLNHLAEALVEKERQLVQLGARITGIRDISTKYESPEIFTLLYQAELSKLITLTDMLSNGLTRVLEMNFDISAIPGDKDKWNIVVNVSKEFRTINLVDRDLRALALLHEKNLIPLPEVFKVLKNADYISESLTYTEFELMVNAESRKNEEEEKRKLEDKAEVEADKEIKIEDKKFLNTLKLIKSKDSNKDKNTEDESTKDENTK